MGNTKNGKKWKNILKSIRQNRETSVVGEQIKN